LDEESNSGTVDVGGRLYSNRKSKKRFSKKSSVLIIVNFEVFFQKNHIFEKKNEKTVPNLNQKTI